MDYLLIDRLMPDLIKMSKTEFERVHSINELAYDFASDIVDSFSLTGMWDEDILATAFKEIHSATSEENALLYMRELWIVDTLNNIRDYFLISAEVKRESREYIVNFSTGFMRRVK